MNAQAKPKLSVIKILSCLVIFTSCGVTLMGCDMANNQLKFDRDRNKEAQNFRDELAPRLPEVKPAQLAAAADASIPSLQPYVAAAPTNMKPMPLVSISVNQSVPLRDVLYELAQQAKYDLELDPNITGSIIFSAHDRPFDEVIARIADVGGLRYKFENDMLHVELDTPYNKTYKIDYLSYIRKNKSSIRNNVAVVTGDGADTGSAYEADGESEANFWGELEQNIQQVLGGSDSGALKTKKTPKITATDQNPQVQATNATPATGAPAPAGGKTNVSVQTPQAVLKVESLPTDEDDTDKNPSGATDKNPNGATFTINKQAGIINVYASEKAQKEIEAYFRLVKKAVTSQVLIESKIMEVTLFDEYQAGIDWRAINLPGQFHANFLSAGSSTVLDGLSSSTLGALPRVSVNNQNLVFGASPSFMLGFGGNDADAIFSAISGFGTVKALASPRLTVLNNQSAVMNVADNHVYFQLKINVTQASNNGPGTVDISSDIHNVPEGVLVNVQPSINLENNTISLALRPTVTRITAEVPDPAVQFITAANNITGVESDVPQLNVQEIDSVIQLRSGEPIILGGLMQDRAESQQNGVPVLGETPILGTLFKKRADRIHKTELVIFLKATILPTPEDSVDDTDKDIYKAFSGDRHPFSL